MCSDTMTMMDNNSTFHVSDSRGLPGLPDVASVQHTRNLTLLSDDIQSLMAQYKKPRARWPYVVACVCVLLALVGVWQRGRILEILNIQKRAQETLQETPRMHAQALFAQGVLLYEGSHYDQAVRAFQEALSHDATFLPAYRSLGIAYAAQNKSQEALLFYKQYVALAKNSHKPEDASERDVADVEKLIREANSASQLNPTARSTTPGF